MKGDLYIMYNSLIEFLNIWGKDIHSISFKHYDNITECLINKHYILKIK